MLRSRLKQKLGNHSNSTNGFLFGFQAKALVGWRYARSLDGYKGLEKSR